MNNKKQNALSLYKKGDFRKAKQVCDYICSNNPNDPETWCMLCLINLSLNLLEEAEQCGKRATDIAPDYIAARLNTGLAQIRLSKSKDAYIEVGKILTSVPDHGEAHFLMGMCLDADGDNSDRAISHYETALQQLANAPRELIVNLARHYKNTGALDKAKVIIDDYLKGHPIDPAVEMMASTIEMEKGDLDSACARLMLVQRSNDLSERERAQINNKLGIILDKLGSYDDAYKHFSKCNEIASGINRRTTSNIVYDRINRNRAVVTKQNTIKWRAEAADDNSLIPVFLVSFPRSGTTLTERIIASNPNVLASGEEKLLDGVIAKLGAITSNALGYPYNLIDITASQTSLLRKEYWDQVKHKFGGKIENKIFLDKLPLNIIELCLINRIFPEAPILFVLRDPRDVCLSCFMQYFEPNNAMSNFYDLESTARFYDATMKLWYHYEKILDLNLYKFRYEEIVANFEEVTKDIYAFLDIEWSESVLTFYENKNYYTKTPSYSDTCNPIYSRAIGRWRHYQPYMNDVLGILQPHVEKINTPWK